MKKTLEHPTAAQRPPKGFQTSSAPAALPISNQGCHRDQPQQLSLAHPPTASHTHRMKFDNVTADATANIYFDGKVVSHAIITADGEKKTLGVILPGSYHFNTEAAELMEIVGGSCEVTLDGTDSNLSVPAGSSFNVPANSGFTINVSGDPCHYVCSFLQ